MNFRLDIFFESFPSLFKFVWITLFITLIAFSLALLLALLLNLIEKYRIPVLNSFAKVYISFFRSTPMISQLFFFYFAVTPLIPFLKNASPTVSIILVLAMNESSFMAESIRGALNSVDKGQYEAGLVIGMTELEVFRRVVIPQAFRVALPSLSNSFIGTMKGTSLGFTIGVVEIMAQAKLLASKNYRVMESYMAALIIYWIIVILLVRVQKIIENKLNRAY